VIFDKTGNVVSKAAVEHRQYYPKPGWVEHNPVEIYANTLKSIHMAMKKVCILYQLLWV
jgi:glycerol kinase